MILVYLVAAFLLLTPLAVVRMRSDYRRLGRLSWLGFGVLVVWFFLPHLSVDFAVRYPRSWGWRQTLGLGVALLGLAMLLVAIVSFRSVKKVFARDPGRLTVAGPYRWSRNPQYVGWFLFVLGFAVIGWTWWCCLSLALLAAALTVLVQVEEEHLGRTFGHAFLDYRARAPRWLGPVRKDSGTQGRARC